MQLGILPGEWDRIALPKTQQGIGLGVSPTNAWDSIISGQLFRYPLNVTVDPSAQMPSMPGWPELPKLPSLPDIHEAIKPPWSDPINKALDGVGTVVSWLTDPVRLATVVVGLGFLFGGLYLLGTSQLTDALNSLAKASLPK